MERINECTLFDRIKVTMMEWHYDGEERILEILKNINICTAILEKEIMD